MSVLIAGSLIAATSTLHRRCEIIETTGHGELYARCAGDPADPLVLYVHDPRDVDADSSVWSCALMANLRTRWLAWAQEPARGPRLPRTSPLGWRGLARARRQRSVSTRRKVRRRVTSAEVAESGLLPLYGGGRCGADPEVPAPPAAAEQTAWGPRSWID